MFASYRRNTCFQFEPGQYHFYQENTSKRRFPVSNSDRADFLNIALLLENMSHISIIGEGAEFIFHGEMTPIAVSECSEIHIEGLSIDFAVPLSAEARIMHVEPGAVEILLKRESFPYYIADNTLIFERGFGQEAPLFGALEFDAGTNKVRAGAGDTFPRVRAYDAGTDMVRLEGEFTVLPKVGNILVLRHGSRVHPGALIQYSEGISFKNIMVHQTGGLGFLFQFNKDISVSGISFEANYARGFSVLSGHDDGLHFSNNRGTVTINGCSFRGLMDDPVNVHGTGACVLKKIDGDTLLGEFCHPQSTGFPRWAVSGDRVAFIRPNNRKCYAEAEVLEYRLLNDTEFELTLKSPLPLEMCEGDAMENLTNTPSLICRDNYFGSVRARGLLVTTKQPVLIENNIFESSGSAILLSGDMKEWYESGTCEDVIIRHNQFLNCCSCAYQFCRAVLHVEPGVDKGQEAVVHHNIRIEDNLFLLYSPMLLYAENAGDITLQGNSIYLQKEGQNAEIVLQESRNVSVRDNKLSSGSRLLIREIEGDG